MLLTIISEKLNKPASDNWISNAAAEKTGSNSVKENISFISLLIVQKQALCSENTS